LDCGKKVRKKAIFAKKAGILAHLAKILQRQQGERAMGKAMEWLGTDRCRVIAEEILEGVEDRGGDEIWAHCPWHRESTPGGAFSYNPQRDVAKCNSCGQAGDLIAVYCGVNGYPLDGSEGFLAFKKAYAADAASTPKTAHSRPARKDWAPHQTAEAPTSWHEKAGKFVEHSCERLDKTDAVQTQLNAWGITMATAHACRFGWNDKDKSVPRAAWGLPEQTNPRTGKPKKIWLPRGLVMPMFVNGRVAKLKIRRPEAMTSWGEELRYWEVPGGENNRFHVYGRPDWRVWVLVETERDAALVWQNVRHMQIGAMGLGGAGKRPAERAATILRGADLILVALDLDDAGASNAGKFWAKEFPQSLRWPAPPSMGKDIGDAVRDYGLDVAAWVRSGLPCHVARVIDRELDRKRRATPQSVSHKLETSEDQTLPEMLQEMVGIVRQYPVKINVQARQPLPDQTWLRADRERWNIYRRAAWLAEHEDVRDFLKGCDVELLTGKNLDAYLREYWRRANQNKAQSVPVKIKSLYTCMSKGPLQLHRDTLHLEYKESWARKKKNWQVICRVSNDLLMEDNVLAWIARHPAETISAGNFWENRP
jgi:hypothetical protein